MLFKSAYADFQVLVRSEAVQYHPATGVEIGRTRALTANFGSHGGVFNAPDPLTGEITEHSMVFGHYFDSDAAQQERGWTDDERESVEAAILKIAREQPSLVAQVIIEIPPAPKPWPSFDEQTAKEITAVAIQAGLVSQALAYERENKNRSTLVSELEELVVAQEVAAAKREQEPVEITL